MSRLSLRPAQHNDLNTLVDTLANEFQHYDDPNQEYRQPLIDISQPGERVHITVIWDVWAEVSQQERSSIIMDAYRLAHPPYADANVTFAMGLTQTEARGLGINFEEAPVQ